MDTQLVTQNRQDSLPSLRELPQQLTECELRNPFKLETTRDGSGASVSRKVFIPPSPEDGRELESVRLALQVRLEPCRPEIVITALARLANHHKSERTSAEWQALYEDYVHDLAEFSNAHVLQALHEHRQTSKWFPKVSEVRERCVELRNLDQIRLRRVVVSLTGKEAP